MRDIGRYRLLTATEERRLAERIQRGDERARQRLVQANLRLVVAIARRSNRKRELLEDLIEEGNIGLMLAARRYDPRRGVRFGCYAGWWIRKFVRAALKVYEVRSALPAEMRPTDSAKTRNGPTARAGTEESTPVRLRILSFEELPRDSSGTNAIDSRIPTRDPTPDEHVNKAEVADRVRQVVALMSAEQRFVLEARHGINGHAPTSLQRIADSMGCTREWVLLTLAALVLLVGGNAGGAHGQSSLLQRVEFLRAGLDAEVLRDNTPALTLVLLVLLDHDVDRLLGELADPQAHVDVRWLGDHLEHPIDLSVGSAERDPQVRLEGSDVRTGPDVDVGEEVVETSGHDGAGNDQYQDDYQYADGVE
jgi:RNA polymerase sigma factor (sigma-70 family)